MASFFADGVIFEHDDLKNPSNTPSMRGLMLGEWPKNRKNPSKAPSMRGLMLREWLKKPKNPSNTPSMRGLMLGV